MRKFTLATLVIAFAAACSHNQATPDQKTAEAATQASSTNDQPSQKKHKNKKEKTAASNLSAADSVKCTHGNDARSIEVKAKAEGCETVYTKLGETKTIATSGHGQDHCKEVSLKIQEHLTGAGFSCQ